MAQGDAAVRAGAANDVIVSVYFQINRAIPTTPWEMVTNATLVTKIVLGLLAVLSLLSWAVMLGKWLEFRRVRRAGDAFMRSFDRAQSLRLVLDAETNGERDSLSRFVPTLASIGSVSPLIGLLGTVLGVISAFTGIATQGSGNISAVAPGIGEALMATAAALAVAIPAVFGYNICANRVNRLDSELEGFGSELIALMVREGRI